MPARSDLARVRLEHDDEIERRRGEHVWLAAPDGALHAREIVAITPSRSAEVHHLRVSAPDTYFAHVVLVHND